MSFKMNGFDELSNKLNKMNKGVEEVNKRGEVSFGELFTDSFMRSHTKFSKLDKFFEASGFDVSSSEAFSAIPDEEIDAFTAQNSEFDSWEEMLSTAGQEYILKKMGF
ncbi:hypothetical protein [Enterococcus diestrammenae]|uniref:hypothetical protein n=1 Tax=Enterococcus diestrammenae TaxID=1155073 RepID=UPI00195CFDB5